MFNRNFIIAIGIILSQVITLAQVASEHTVQGNKNYLINEGFEKGKTGWTFDGSGLTIQFLDDDLSSIGKQTAVVTVPNGNTFNLMQTIPVDKTLSNRNCTASMWVDGGSNTLGYLTVYQGNNPWSMSEIDSNFRVAWTAGSAKQLVISSFICPDYQTFGALQIRWTVVNSSGSNLTYKFDNAYLGLADFGEVSNVTSWKEIAAVAGTHIKAVTTNPTFGTVTVNKLLYRVVGNALEVEWSYNQTTGGSAGSGMYLIDVSGLGYTFDLSKLSHNTSGGPTGSTVGSIYSWDAASAGQGQSGMCYMYDATKIKCIGVQAQGSSGIAGNSTWPTSINFSTSNYNVGVHLTIPIIGQTNSTVINAECPDQYACVDTFTATVSDAGVISNANIAGWINNFSVSDTSLFTGNFKSGLFSQKPVCVATINAGDDTTVYGVKLIDASTNSSTIVYRTGYATSTKYAYRTNISCTRSGSDFKGKRVLQAEISPLYYFEGTVTTTSANNPIGVATVVEDQWGNWDNTNKRYTAKEGGIYEVSMGLSSIDINTTIVVWKNGVTTNKRVLYISSDGTQSTATLRLNANEYIDVRPTTSPVLTNGFLYIKRLGK